MTGMTTNKILAYSQATKIVTDHVGNKVEVPRKPTRIASLHTMSTTVMLWELGAPLIGTATRLKSDENNRPYIRSVEEIYGIKFKDTKLVNYGKFGEDIEQIKASKPDLIVGTQRHRKVYDTLSIIAPTVLINFSSPDLLGVYKDLASWIDKDVQFAQKTTVYKKHLADVRRKFSKNPSTQTVGYAMPSSGRAQYIAHIQYGAFTRVAYDLGFKPLPFLKKFLDSGKRGRLSAETFGQYNPDWLLSTFRKQTGETIEDVYEDFDDIAPGWRSYNSAYKRDQIIVISRERAIPMSFKSLHWILDQFEKHAK